MKFLTGILYSENLIDTELFEKIENEKNKLKTIIAVSSTSDRLKLTYEKRAELAKCPASAKLLSLMAQKKSNLCVAADVSDIQELLKLADQLGPHICVFKTHFDIIADYTSSDYEQLKSLAEKHNFIVMEDRKLADIGNTVKLQFEQICKWATLVTAHSVPGFGLLEAIKTTETFQKDMGVFLVAEMSCKNNLITPDYTKKTLSLAENYTEIVSGIVCQFSVSQNPGLIQLTPGVKLGGGTDNLGQQYSSPESVIVEKGADIAVVGRGIIAASNPAEEAKKYRESLWQSYLKRVQQ